jgi:hypothetical protein
VLRQLIHGTLGWSVNRFDKNEAKSVEELEQAVMSMVLSYTGRNPTSGVHVRHLGEVTPAGRWKNLLMAVR